MQQITFFDVCDPTPPAVCDLLSYDHYIVMFSGGKDSAALYLALRDTGVPNTKIELWHHEIDGREGASLVKSSSKTTPRMRVCSRSWSKLAW